MRRCLRTLALRPRAAFCPTRGASQFDYYRAVGRQHRRQLNQVGASIAAQPRATTTAATHHFQVLRAAPLVLVMEFHVRAPP